MTKKPFNELCYLHYVKLDYLNKKSGQSRFINSKFKHSLTSFVQKENTTSCIGKNV